MRDGADFCNEEKYQNDMMPDFFRPTRLTLILSRRRLVKRKCPKWLVPICISNPSSVLKWGQVITPALFRRTSIRSSLALISYAHFLTEARLDRSHL